MFLLFVEGGDLNRLQFLQFGIQSLRFRHNTEEEELRSRKHNATKKNDNATIKNAKKKQNRQKETNAKNENYV